MTPTDGQHHKSNWLRFLVIAIGGRKSRMSYHGGVRRLTQMGSVVDAAFGREIERREMHLADGSMSTGYKRKYPRRFKKADIGVQNKVRAI